MIFWTKELKLENKYSELEQLKSLLLSSELKQLKILESKYEALKEASYSEETVINKVTLLFNEILTKRFENEGEETIEIFSQYITPIIAQAYKTSPQALSDVLKDTIAQSIGKEIENNKDSMIDSLYPIMGGMISKYVSQAIKEMMQNINTKIEDGLSIDKYKRKLKSKMTGVSESEILLQESNTAMISSLLIIQKDSGLLIAEAQLEDNEIYDPHMVASMASAIRDFINDWIQQNDSQDEVQILTYGEATLYIESAGSVYIIAFLNKEPEYELRGKINTFFALLVQEYASFFRTFEGDDNAYEVETLSLKLGEYLEQQINIPHKSKKQNYSKYTVYILGISYVFYLCYRLGVGYFEYQIQSQIEEETAQKVQVYYTQEAFTLEGYVDSIEKIAEVEQSLEQSYPEYRIQNRLLVPMKILLANEEARYKMLKLKLLEKLVSVKTSISQKEEKYQKQIDKLRYTLKGTENRLESIKLQKQKEQKRFEAKRASISKEIQNKLSEVFKDNPYYIASESALDFGELNIFAVGAYQYNAKAVAILRKDFRKYLLVLIPYRKYINHLIIEGHSDSRGIYEDNLKLSEKRAFAIKKTLLELEEVKDYNMQSLFTIERFASKNNDKDNYVTYKEASRRIKIKFDLKENEILNILGKILND